MKKFFIVIMSLVCFWLSVCFGGCNIGETSASSTESPFAPTTTAYYGVVQTLEDYEGLYVYIPSMGVCNLPSYAEGVQSEVKLKDGDLICMTFESEEIEVLEVYPGRIVNPVKSITVEMENVQLQRKENDFILVIDYTNAIKEDFIAYEKDYFDTVYFTSLPYVENEEGGGAKQLSEYCTATIEDYTGDKTRLYLRLQLGEYTIQDFLEKFSARCIRLQAEISSKVQPLQNFFALYENLEKSDIKKVEIINYPGCIAPSESPPIEYKESTLLDDIDVVYAWLKGLKGNLVEVMRNEVSAEGGGASTLIVYTDFGTFKIFEMPRGLRIWGRYFKQKGEIRFPDIQGETVTYTFDCYFNEANLYIDGEEKGVYNFEFNKIMCKETAEEFTTQQEYKLVTDIGELTLYDGKHFERNGMKYEIINEIDFSKIFEDFPLK